MWREVGVSENAEHSTSSYHCLRAFAIGRFPAQAELQAKRCIAALTPRCNKAAGKASGGRAFVSRSCVAVHPRHSIPATNPVEAAAHHQRREDDATAKTEDPLKNGSRQRQVQAAGASMRLSGQVSKGEDKKISMWIDQTRQGKQAMIRERGKQHILSAMTC